MFNKTLNDTGGIFRQIIFFCSCLLESILDPAFSVMKNIDIRLFRCAKYEIDNHTLVWRSCFTGVALKDLLHCSNCREV